jgi:hypothetical protein
VLYAWRKVTGNGPSPPAPLPTGEGSKSLRPLGEGLGEGNIKPMERIKMVMTRGKDDPKALYDVLGTKEYRKELDRQFKNTIVVDMWLTGFDVPFLNTRYIDKPIQRHNLIQTISRVNRRFECKEKGLVVDYIGIKKQMNLALAHYDREDQAAQHQDQIAPAVAVPAPHPSTPHPSAPLRVRALAVG